MMEQLQERRKYLVDECITLLGRLIEADEEDEFYLFQKNLETLLDAMQTMAEEDDEQAVYERLKTTMAEEALSRK